MRLIFNGHLVEKIDIGNHGNADEEIAKVGEHYQHLSTWPLFINFRQFSSNVLFQMCSQMTFYIVIDNTDSIHKIFSWVIFQMCLQIVCTCQSTFLYDLLDRSRVPETVQRSLEGSEIQILDVK